jgi:hypothetical protein
MHLATLCVYVSDNSESSRHGPCYSKYLLCNMKESEFFKEDIKKLRKHG